MLRINAVVAQLAEFYGVLVVPYLLHPAHVFSVFIRDSDSRLATRAFRFRGDTNLLVRLSRYSGYFIAMLDVYHVPQGLSPEEITSNSPHKYLAGKSDVQLAHSLNGAYWKRTARTPMIPNGAPVSNNSPLNVQYASVVNAQSFYIAVSFPARNVHVKFDVLRVLAGLPLRWPTLPVVGPAHSPKIN